MSSRTPTTASAAAPLEIRRRATFRLWLVNLGVAVLLGLNYLGHVPDAPAEMSSARLWLFALPALISTAVTVTLLPCATFWVAARFVESSRVFGWVQGVFWTLFQVLLFADTRIYNMFRYHFNGQVLNLVAVRGSQDAIHLGWRVWLSIVVGFLVVVTLQMMFWRRTLRSAARPTNGRRSALAARPWMLAVILVPTVFLDKALYARADLTRDREVTRLARLFPLYARLPMEDFASRVLGVEMERPPRVELGGFELDYPHARPAIDPAGPRPNVVVVVIDCLRQDRLTPEHMPLTARFAEGGLRFEDHVSAGNSTRFGLFTLLYGLHGSYWFPVLGEQRSPVLIDTLAELGYEFGIFGSASMEYPEMRSTLWASIPDAVHDEFAAEESWRRDELAAEAMIAWLAAREGAERPFFGFLLLDSPHQTYSHPPDTTPFTPTAPDIDYLSLTQNEGPEPELLEAVRNRYDNAVFHADRVAGQVLAAVEAASFGPDTLVVVTGDHGEEFLECGFFGHTSAFTPQQVRVPLVLRGAGITPGVETRPTSHLDFAPTLLELLGAHPAGRDAWCLGENLLAPLAERRRVLGGWNELGVWTPEGILRVPLSLFDFDIEVFDYDWNLLVDDRDVLRAETETLEQLGAECNRFLR